jgi:glycosyltransferase involved in cell wall biosynthesis
MLDVGERETLRRRGDHAVSQWILHRADLVVTGPETMVEFMRHRWNLRPDKMRLLYNDVDVDRFTPLADAARPAAREHKGIRPGEWVVLVVQRLGFRHGTWLLVPLMEELRRRGLVDVTLVVVGGGDDEARLRAEAAASPARDQLRVIGPVPNADLPAWYQVCNAFLLPSYEEGFPRTLIEGMASARPVVTTRVGGTADVVGSYPFVVEPGDLEGMADALTKLHDSDAAAQAELGAALRARVVERFSTPQVAAMLARVLSS